MKLPVNKPRVKVCCVSSVEEAKIAIRYGASALGLVSDMPSGPGVISEDLILKIVKIVPPGVASVLLTSMQNIDDIIEQQRKLKVNTIQIVDELKSGTHRELKQALPGVSIIQVIHVNGEEAIQEALSLEDQVDAFLLDTGNRSLRVKILGGTGRTHDWTISDKLRRSVKVPIFLAGGLNTNNIQEAIEKVKPFAVDLCSGLRTNGKLDETKVSLFFQILQS